MARPCQSMPVRELLSDDTPLNKLPILCNQFILRILCLFAAIPICLGHDLRPGRARGLVQQCEERPAMNA